MALLIENLAKQLATLTPATQAKLFEYLAQIANKPGLKELAEYYQRLLNPTDSSAATDFSGNEAQTASKPRPYQAEPEKALPRRDRAAEHIAAYESVQAKAPEEVKSYQELYATFDGEVLRPEGKIDLDLNTRYKLLVEKPVSEFPEIKIRAFQRIMERAIHTGIHDFAEQHDHYLYGVAQK